MADIEKMTDEQFDRWLDDLIALEPADGVFTALPQSNLPYWEKWCNDAVAEGTMTTEVRDVWLGNLRKAAL